MRLLETCSRSAAIAALAAIVALAAAPTQAGVISYGDLTPGANFVDLGFATVESSPRPFEHKTVNGITGVGVAGGFVGGEIDLHSESITIRYREATRVSQISLGFLFHVGNFNDQVSEVARITLSGDPFQAGDLSVIDPFTATWSFPGGGPVTALSAGDESHAGVWQILNPFGDMLVTGLTLTALFAGDPGPSGSANSDYSLISVTDNVPVPEPGSLALFGVGLLSLGLIWLRKTA